MQLPENISIGSVKEDAPFLSLDGCAVSEATDPRITEDQQLRQLALAGVESIVSTLGEGSFGMVYCCIVAGYSEPVAVKVGKTGDSLPSDSREVAVLSELSHPNVVGLLHVVQGPPLILLFDYCSGGNLEEFVHVLGRSVFESWPLAFRAYTMLDVASAMAYLHGRDIVHRDLKPANVLYSTPPELACVPVAKLADLGLARFRDASLSAKMTNMVGTAAYMSPEMVLDEDYDSSTDVYSWAIMSHEVCSGRRPYTDEGPVGVARLLVSICGKGLRPDLELLPAAEDSTTCLVKGLISKCWSHEAEERESAAGIVASLKNILGLEE